MLELKLVLHDAKTDPPKRSMSHDECVVVMPGGNIDTVSYSTRYNLFNVRDIDCTETPMYPIYPLFWAELPAELRGLYRRA